MLPFSASAAKSKTPAGPRLLIDATDRDAGTVGEGEPAGASFSIGNQGNRTLHLSLSSKSDGLRNDPPLSLDVPPRQKKTIRIDIDTWKVTGKTTLTVTYGTNDPAHSSVALAIGVVVKAFVVANPGFARYTYVQQEAPGSVIETIFAVDRTPISVTAIHSPVPWLTVSFRQATDDEGMAALPQPEWRASITIQPNAPVGPIAEVVRVDVDHPLQKEVRIPVSGFVRPIFAVTPVAADLGRVTIGRPLGQSGIYIQNFASERIDLTEPQVNVAGLAVTIETIDPGHQYRARVSLTDEAKEGPFAGTIVMRTSSAKEPYLTIPIRGEFIR